MKRLLFIATFTFVISSCQKENFEIVKCPPEISERAFYFAKKYVESNTEYLWGGQDLLNKDTIKIDCSGLIVNCYKYAIVGTEYALLFDDINVLGLYNQSYFHATPMRGDLIFFSENENSNPTHIGIVDTIKNEYVYFIDSTQKDDIGINGVSVRKYKVDEEDVFFYFGSLKLKVAK